MEKPLGETSSKRAYSKKTVFDFPGRWGATPIPGEGDVNYVSMITVEVHTYR